MGQASRGALKLMFITASVLPAKSWVFYIAMPANSSHGLLNCCKITLCLFQNCLSDGTTAGEDKILRISATRALMLEPGTIAKKRKEKHDEERLSDLEATE